MKETKERIAIIADMKELIRAWEAYVNSVGNECAYTDSIIKKLQKKAKDLG